MDFVKIIESVEDYFQFDRAFVAEEDGELVPRAVLRGVVCSIDTKPGPLAAGIAYCAPVTPSGLQDWPLEVIVEKEAACGGTYREVMQNCTANPKVVAAARHWADLVASGKAKAGMEL